MGTTDNEQTTGPTSEKLALAEDFALVLERMGLVRMTGRAAGWLLVGDPPGQTFGQIADALQASKERRTMTVLQSSA